MTALGLMGWAVTTCRTRLATLTACTAQHNVMRRSLFAQYAHGYQCHQQCRRISGSAGEVRAPLHGNLTYRGEDVSTVRGIEQLSMCPVLCRLPVQWGEMDAFNHVNNTVFFRYFESGRTTYFAKLQEVSGQNFMSVSGIAPIMADAYTKFKRPLKYPDDVIVGIYITDVQDTQFVQRYKLLSCSSGKVAAEGFGTVVFLDYKKHTRASIPAPIVKAIQTLQPDLV